MTTLGRTAGAVCGIAVGLVIGLAACGNAVAGAGGSAKLPAAAGSKAATKTAPSVNPGGPMVPATAKHVQLCSEIPDLTRMVFTRTGWPPTHAREALPTGFTVRDPATVRRIAAILCGLPKLPIGVMSCPNLAGGTYRLYFAAGRRPLPTVGIGLGGCRVVTGLGPPRSWTTSKALEQALSQGLGAPFKRFPSPLS